MTSLSKGFARWRGEESGRLLYDQVRAPVLVAKGQGAFAEEIIAVAKSAGVHLAEDLSWRKRCLIAAAAGQRTFTCGSHCAGLGLLAQGRLPKY